jgi:hypothetical protein
VLRDAAIDAGLIGGVIGSLFYGLVGNGAGWLLLCAFASGILATRVTNGLRQPRQTL